MKVEHDNVRLYHLDGNLIAEWQGERLIDSFKKKMPALVVVNAETRINSDEKEEFWYNEAFYLTQPNEDNLLDLIKQDIIIVDVIPFLLDFLSLLAVRNDTENDTN